MPAAPASPSDTRSRSTSWDRATWRTWVTRTTLGEAAGFLFPVLVVLSGADDLPTGPRFAVLLLAGAVEGAVLGWAQSSVLVPLVAGFSKRDWILRTALAATLAWAIGMGPSTWAAGLVDVPMGGVVVLAVPAGVVLLCSIGVAQWTV